MKTKHIVVLMIVTLMLVACGADSTGRGSEPAVVSVAGDGGQAVVADERVDESGTGEVVVSDGGMVAEVDGGAIAAEALTEEEMSEAEDEMSEMEAEVAEEATEAEKEEAEAVAEVEAEESQDGMSDDEMAKPMIETSLGTFVIDSARFVDEVRGQPAGPDAQYLLVALAGEKGEELAPGSVDLMAFNEALKDVSQGDLVHVTGSDDFYMVSTMGGWLGDEFVIGFVVPNSVTDYQLFWPGNELIEIVPEG
ncbi:MAG TPA: hypothetical protein VLL52_02730 [Anaerolineae bacterium]|nr:hypothetical protein [Anaerolineae bacterium]